MCIVYGEQNRPARRKIDHKPVEPMHKGKRRIFLLPGRVAGQYQPFRGARHPREQLSSLVGARIRAPSFQELPNDAKCKVTFQIGAACPKNQSADPLRRNARGVEHRRLAHAGATFND
jgi:hypothetical protein